MFFGSTFSCAWVGHLPDDEWYAYHRDLIIVLMGNVTQTPARTGKCNRFANAGPQLR